MIGRKGSASASSHRKSHVEKLCMDAKQDRERLEEILDDPNVEVLEKIPCTTPKGVLWLTILYNRRGPEPEAKKPTIMDQIDKAQEERESDTQEEEQRILRN